MMDSASIGKDKNRLWCILQDEKLFYMGGYKALNMTSDDSGIAHCMKSSDNGKIKLSYDISGYSALSDEIGRLSVEDIVAVVKSLTQSAMIINNNGMMSLRSTLFDRKMVFISGSKNHGFKTLLIYLPVVVQTSMGGDDGTEDFFRFLRELLHSAGRVSVDPDLRPLSIAIERNSSLDSFSEQLSKLHVNSNGGSDDGSNNSGKNIHTEEDEQKQGGNSGGGNEKDNKTRKKKKSKKPSRRKKASGKIIALIATQLCAIALAIAAYLYVGLLAVAAVLFVDAIAVVIIFTVGTGKRHESSYDIEQDLNIGGGFGDTEEFDDFTPTVRLVGQNTPMMLKYVIDKAEFSIGRSADCDALIPETLKAISGHHCRVVTENGTMFVYDDHVSGKRVGSKNGTYINGGSSRIDSGKKARLQINDTLQLANYRFKVEHV